MCEPTNPAPPVTSTRFPFRSANNCFLSVKSVLMLFRLLIAEIGTLTGRAFATFAQFPLPGWAEVSDKLVTKEIDPPELSDRKVTWPISEIHVRLLKMNRKRDNDASADTGLTERL